VSDGARADTSSTQKQCESEVGGAVDSVGPSGFNPLAPGGRAVDELTQAERADLQREADAYVQVITAGEEPFQIVWASEAWLRLCEYEAPQVLGHTLEKIQGPLTDQHAVNQLMGAIRGGNPVTLSMINHTRTGKPFSHTLRVEPLRDSRGNVQCFQATSANIDTSIAMHGSAGGTASGAALTDGDAADSAVDATPDSLMHATGLTETSLRAGLSSPAGSEQKSVMKRTASKISMAGMDVATDDLQISEMLDLFDQQKSPDVGPARSSSTAPPEIRLDAQAADAATAAAEATHVG